MKNFICDFIKNFFKEHPIFMTLVSLAGIFSVYVTVFDVDINIEHLVTVVFNFNNHKDYDAHDAPPKISVSEDDKENKIKISKFHSDEKNDTSQYFDNKSNKNKNDLTIEESKPQNLESTEKIILNNTFETALPIENKKKYFGTFIKKNDQMFYKLILDSQSTINFLFVPSGKTSYKLTIQNLYQDTVFENEMSLESISPKKGNIYLKEGTYVMKISSGNSWEEKFNGNDFELTVEISTHETETEAEPNNTKRTANVIPVNKHIRASSYKNDIDYFEFTLDKQAFISPQFELKPALNNYELKLYELIVTDDSGEEIKKFNFRGDNTSEKIKPFMLGAGTYMICISRVEDKSRLGLGLHEYTLFVSAKETF